MWSLVTRMKYYLRIVIETFPPPSEYEPSRDMPDMSGKVIIVTGGNTGIGKATVKALLLKNAKVYMACRSESKALAAIDDLKSSTGKEAIFLHLDLASMNSVTKAAKEFMSKETELHILFNSAGVMYTATDIFTEDGYDLQFGVNVLGHAHLTISLLPILLSTAKSSPEHHVRVVNVASAAIYMAPLSGIQWNTLKEGRNRRNISSQTLYGQSKLGNVIFSKELGRRYGNEGIVSTSLHPGIINTELWANVPMFARFIFRYSVFSTPEKGAITPLWVGTSPAAASMNGQYFIPWARIGPTRPECEDPVLGQQLWEWVLEQRRGY